MRRIALCLLSLLLGASVGQCGLSAPAFTTTVATTTVPVAYARAGER